MIGQALTVEGDAETFAARLRGLIGEIQQQPSPDGLRGRAEDALREGQVLVQRDVEQVLHEDRLPLAVRVRCVDEDIHVQKSTSVSSAATTSTIIGSPQKA